MDFWQYWHLSMEGFTAIYFQFVFLTFPCWLRNIKIDSLKTLAFQKAIKKDSPDWLGYVYFEY